MSWFRSLLRVYVAFQATLAAGEAARARRLLEAELGRRERVREAARLRRDQAARRERLWDELCACAAEFRRAARAGRYQTDPELALGAAQRFALWQSLHEVSSADFPGWEEKSLLATTREAADFLQEFADRTLGTTRAAAVRGRVTRETLDPWRRRQRAWAEVRRTAERLGPWAFNGWSEETFLVLGLFALPLLGFGLGVASWMVPGPGPGPRPLPPHALPAAWLLAAAGRGVVGVGVLWAVPVPLLRFALVRRWRNRVGSGPERAALTTRLTATRARAIDAELRATVARLSQNPDV